MKNGKMPDPMVLHPIPGYEKEIYVRPSVRNPQIMVGDFTYIADSEFESHVSHLYPWNDERLVIGKFCQIASGVEFVMNGANHQMNAVSTFPFYTLEGWNMEAPDASDMPLKGDTVVGSDVEAYTIVVGNPARVLRKRFDDELIALLEEWKWWDKTAAEIDKLIPILTNGDLKKVKEEIRRALGK